MTYLPRVAAFGILAGAGWSLVPGVLTELLGDRNQTLAAVASGMATGVVVSLLLHRSLLRVRLGSAALLGAASLPVGAFVFGVTISLAHLLAQAVTGGTYRFAEGGFEPISIASHYVVYSVWPFGPLLFPMAALTTCCLHRVVARAAR